MLVEIVTPLHTATKRTYLPRMADDKVEAMQRARLYEYDYWDGDRRYGYGGYRYDGRWKPVAEGLIEHYKLSPGSSVLDVGCGKAFLLYELQQLGMNVSGVDRSKHAIEQAKVPVKYGFAEDGIEGNYDLIISLACLHNLTLPLLKRAVKAIEAAGKNKYIMVESYRNPEELFNLQCWALTAESFFTPQEWEFLFREWRYTGDWEFIYFV